LKLELEHMLELDEPIAVLADIHGNLWALQAVLEDIERRGIRTILNLGDTLYGPLDPAGTAHLLMGMDMLHVQGNEDRAVWNPPEQPGPTLAYTIEALDEAAAAWLKAQPLTAIYRDELFLCHGTPASDLSYLLEKPHADGGLLRDEEAIRADLVQCSQKMILCGHSHMPRLVRLNSGRMVLNPGSVGLPAYSDDTPVFHRMQTGSPEARYAVLTACKAGWRVEHAALAYDWQKAAAAARRNRREDWAFCLETGRAG